ncbi:organic cation transporter protein [Lepeophtheirus salmonis]|uniref:organic cation transporter protein n=1 Tax=Lepeophtheirus salmonis TaxID=72036 RepID=UPI001AEB150B|nr:organic cation transporter protein-like [Lepeophtheirus salmonis]XP_040573549.1 organic cation transporter protein-like [Lepeophtheirus salmonis]XP_040573550.1 organic cation transporter protein-like [Lepeophtheirus salmonis]XP_040573551.1 organic cation transporter protein-like [Lepeophtheirus salmonis]
MGATETQKVIDFNSILDEIGGFGKWQKKNFFLLWLTSMAAGLAVVVFSFTGNVPDHRCSVPFCENLDSDYNAYTNYTNLNKSRLFPSSCTYLSNSKLNVPDVPSKESCKTYLDTISQVNEHNLNQSCDAESVIYDLYQGVRSSISMDSGWVCEHAYIGTLVGASYMIGMLIGSFVLGIFSDKYGRRLALIVSILLVSIPSIIASFAHNIYMFIFLRILTGMGGIGCFMVSFVLVVEYVSLEYTLLIGIAIEIPFAIGELILGLEAYFVREWVHLQLVAYTPLIALLGLWFIIPESPRWLLSVGREKEAGSIISSAIKENGKNIDVDLLISQNQKDLHNSPSDKKTQGGSFMDMFTPVPMLLRSLNMFYQWFSVTLCYYGLSFASTSLSGDIYTNFALAVFIEIPAYIVCMFLMDCWGRRPILSIFQIMSGVSCIIAGLLSVYTDSFRFSVHIFFFLLGKFGGSACFAIIYVYSAELFPTNIRNTAIGSCSCVARLGGVCAFIIGLLKSVWVPLPMIIVGIIASVAGVLAFGFPETIGSSLPETKEDALNIEKGRRRGFLECSTPWWYKRKVNPEIE